MHGDTKENEPRTGSRDDGDRGVPSARTLAADTLARVWEDGAYAAATLDAGLRRAPRLDPRDVALATELVYGVLRTTASLEREIARFAKGDRYRRKPAIRAHLLIATYSLLFLERVPAFAAVAEAVAAVKGLGGAQIAGFANAVLRKIAREGRVGERDVRLRDAIVESVPAWLRERLRESLGGSDEAVRELLAPGALAPSVCLCARAGADPAAWLETLRAALPAATVERGELSERALVVRGGGDPAAWPGAGEAWRVQEEGAQLIAQALAARPGDVVLDACAGRGGKTLLLAEAVGPTGFVDAADRHPKKMAALRAAEAKARGRAAAHLCVRDAVAVDWTLGSGELAGRSYDRILVDAPCTGTGTLRHRPEIAERLSAADVERLAALQLAILARTATHLAPGGTMLYAVCSVLSRECEHVVDALVRTTELVPAPFEADTLRRLAGGGATLHLSPAAHGTDGYFLASLRRK